MNTQRIKIGEKLKVRKHLPSYVTVTRIMRPKKGPGSFNRRPKFQKDF